MDKERLQNFKSYYRQHYDPLINELAEDYNELILKGEERRRLISFLKQDLEELLEELGE